MSYEVGSVPARVTHCLMCEKELPLKAQGIYRYVCSPECQTKYIVRKGRERRKSHKKV